MNKKYRTTFFILLAVAAFIEIILFFFSKEMVVLNPKGIIAEKQLDLLIISTLLMLIIVIPVLFMTFYFIWKYRANNPKAKYDPDWNHSTIAEIVWWTFPCIIVLFLSYITWVSTHDLDPFKPLENGTKPIPIQVVALDWKWLFIYPEEKMATVNFIQFPINTPVSFQITSDAPMNSFWIPQLAGQIYAMPGMESKLHLMANEADSYDGSSANLSGKGFAGMKFIAKASSQEDYDAWIKSVKDTGNHLSLDEYNKLVEPSENNPVMTFQSVDEGLFNKILMKYRMP